MKKKLAIAICVHHKPWLIMGTLITLAMQDNKDYDLYFIYQKGEGNCPEKETYKEYREIADKDEGFTQLSPYDENVRLVVEQAKFNNTRSLDFENDHSLDSGAWYKFIKTGLWKDYEYLFFIQEGNLFTRDCVISSAMDFVQKNKIHFLSSAHEKRRLPRNVVFNSNTREGLGRKIDSFHDQKLKEVFEVFNRDKDFKAIFDKWGSDFKIETQNHVPNIADSLTKKILRSIKHIDFDFLLKSTIYVNTKTRVLEDIISNHSEYNNVIFHKDNEPEWFGCSCQHLLSNDFLSSFSKKIDRYGLYDALEIPFCAGSLEIIWGFLPIWLGFDKWFFDGMHRVRKSFTTYRREDSPEGMSQYINGYFRGKLEVKPHGEFLKITKTDKKHKEIKKLLGNIYISE